MINYLAKQTLQTIPTNREQMNRFWKVEKKNVPFCFLHSLQVFYKSTVKHLIYIYTRLDKSKVA